MANHQLHLLVHHRRRHLQLLGPIVLAKGETEAEEAMEEGTTLHHLNGAACAGDDATKAYVQADWVPLQLALQQRLQENPNLRRRM